MHSMVTANSTKCIHVATEIHLLLNEFLVANIDDIRLLTVARIC